MFDNKYHRFQVLICKNTKFTFCGKADHKTTSCEHRQCSAKMEVISSCPRKVISMLFFTGIQQVPVKGQDIGTHYGATVRQTCADLLIGSSQSGRTS